VPQTPTVVLTNNTYNSSTGAGFDLALLSKLIKDNTVSLDFKYSGKVSYTVNLGTATDSYIPLSDLWDGKTPKEVDPACKAAIEDLKMENKFENSVFVVSRALTLQGLTYTFTNNTDTNANLVADIKKILNANANATGTTTVSGTNTTVDPKTPLHIGVQVQLIDTWVPTGAVAALGTQQVIVTGRPVPGNYLVRMQ
jgi:hypothetical protein